MKYVYAYDGISNVLLFKKECVVAFRTRLTRHGVVVEIETEGRNYDTLYRLKLKKTYTKIAYKNKYFVQLRRMQC